MATKYYLITGSWHLGDNPGYFQDATFIGNTLALPLEKISLEPGAKEIKFIFTTYAIETWAAWQGHSVFINGHEIGTIKDHGDRKGDHEVHEITLEVKDFESFLADTNDFTLVVELGRQPEQEGFADDFILKGIETECLFAKVGW